jgi:glycosyltransferase involved in cell wall biosynthesis
MSAKPLTMTVVICAHNEQDWIGRCLASLLEQRRLPDEIVVVDNASTDATADVIQAFIAAHPHSNIVKVDQPRKGLHHAREAGWRAAHGDIIVMTDADITFPADWLQIVETAFADWSVDAITGTVRYNDAHPLVNWVTWISDQLYQPERIGRWMTKEYILSGGNSAYRRKVLETVGGYVDKPQEMLEDRYMSGRIQQLGFKVKFVRANKVWHTFRRYQKEGWRGYLRYMFFYDTDTIYSDHLSEA